jgi:pyridoxine/pyridoxamine 5'-phosphate oxidase
MTHSITNITEIVSLPPENLVARVWQELIRATKDRHHHWKIPALASIARDGSPKVRTIVLRQANQDGWTLDAFTELRSAKCEELSHCHKAQLVFWSDRLRWQLRVTVNAIVYRDGDLIEQAWARVRQSKASKDYLSVQAPGSEITNSTITEVLLLNSPNHHHLGVLRFHVTSMDWLALGSDAHCRAHIDPNGTVTPLTP